MNEPRKKRIKRKYGTYESIFENHAFYFIDVDSYDSLFCASPGLNVLPFLPLNGSPLFKPSIIVLLPGNFI